MHGMHTVVELLCRRNRSLGSRSLRTDALVLRTVPWNGTEAARAASSFLRITIFPFPLIALLFDVVRPKIQWA